MTLTCFTPLPRVKYGRIWCSFAMSWDDIQTLNQKARAGEYELTAISYHAYPYVADKYQLMAAGSSIGDGYGPMVVASHPMSVEELKGKRIAIPGRLTTAYLAMRLMQPDFEPVDTPFDKILGAVEDGKADAGLIIHEAQLTYSNVRFSQCHRSGPLVQGHLRSALAAGRQRAAARS